jgi:hypothetical protein
MIPKKWHFFSAEMRPAAILVVGQRLVRQRLAALPFKVYPRPAFADILGVVAPSFPPIARSTSPAIAVVESLDCPI